MIQKLKKYSRLSRQILEIILGYNDLNTLSYTAGKNYVQIY